MFTRRAGAGNAEARRAGANGVQIEARRVGAEAQIEGQSRECGGSIGDSKMWHCHFIAPAPSCKHQALSALLIPISRDQKRMRLTRSTKDRKKGCAYDPGALNKQGVQTLRYVSVDVLRNTIILSIRMLTACACELYWCILYTSTCTCTHTMYIHTLGHDIRPNYY